MFDPEYFKNLLNETSDYIQNKNKHTDVEDIDAKIESNKLALKLISEDIEDPDLKSEVLHRLNNLYETYEDIEIKQRSVNINQFTEVEEDILKSTEILKNKARRLYDGLIFDKNILESVSSKMNKNITDTGENIRKINRDTKMVNIFSLMMFSISLFLCVYFLIRFI